jgi:hypothetical protein
MLRWRTWHLEECDRAGLFGLTEEQFSHPPGPITLGAHVELLGPKDRHGSHPLWGPWQVEATDHMPVGAKPLSASPAVQVVVYKVSSTNDPMGPSWAKYPYRFRMTKTATFHKGSWQCTGDKQCCG